MAASGNPALAGPAASAIAKRDRKPSWRQLAARKSIAKPTHNTRAAKPSLPQLLTKRARKAPERWLLASEGGADGDAATQQQLAPNRDTPSKEKGASAKSPAKPAAKAPAKPVANAPVKPAAKASAKPVTNGATSPAAKQGISPQNKGPSQKQESHKSASSPLPKGAKAPNAGSKRPATASQAFRKQIAKRAAVQVADGAKKKSSASQVKAKPKQGASPAMKAVKKVATAVVKQKRHAKVTGKKGAGKADVKQASPRKPKTATKAAAHGVKHERAPKPTKMKRQSMAEIKRLQHYWKNVARFKTHVRSQLTRVRREKALIEAYAGEGWKGANRDKPRPESELQRAQLQILKSKVKLREAIHSLDKLSAVGRLPPEAFDEHGEVDAQNMSCCMCDVQESWDDNDLVLCDGECDRGYHQHCIWPPLSINDLPDGDEGWLCPLCDIKVDCLTSINEEFGTELHIGSSWEDVFPEEATKLAEAGDAAIMADDGHVSEEDEEDDDFDPDKPEESEDDGEVEDGGDIEADGEGDSDEEDENEENEEDEEEQSEPEAGEQDEDLDGVEDSELADLMADQQEDEKPSTSGQQEEPQSVILNRRRERPRVDYHALNEAMFGNKESFEGEFAEEEVDWKTANTRRSKRKADRPARAADADAPGPVEKKPRRQPTAKKQSARKEAAHKEDGPTTRAKRLRMSSDANNSVAAKRRRIAKRRSDSRSGGSRKATALQNLFEKTWFPTREEQDATTKSLSISRELMINWFKNARRKAKYHNTAKQPPAEVETPEPASPPQTRTTALSIRSLSEEATAGMKEVFESKWFPTREEQDDMADKYSIPRELVINWFKNARRKAKDLEQKLRKKHRSSNPPTPRSKSEHSTERKPTAAPESLQPPQMSPGRIASMQPRTRGAVRKESEELEAIEKSELVASPKAPKRKRSPQKPGATARALGKRQIKVKAPWSPNESSEQPVKTDDALEQLLSAAKAVATGKGSKKQLTFSSEEEKGASRKRSASKQPDVEAVAKQGRTSSSTATRSDSEVEATEDQAHDDSDVPEGSAATREPSGSVLDKATAVDDAPKREIEGRLHAAPADFKRPQQQPSVLKMEDDKATADMVVSQQTDSSAVDSAHDAPAGPAKESSMPPAERAIEG
eukprot:jgi/Chlat1/6874/Chrsp51S00513